MDVLKADFIEKHLRGTSIDELKGKSLQKSSRKTLRIRRFSKRPAQEAVKDEVQGEKKYV